MPSREKRNTQCGILCFRPKFLQCCSNLVTFTIFYCPTALFTSALGVYIASQITTLERFFGFTSSQSGLIMSCNDIGYLMTILFVSYLARKVHIPFALSLSTILYGISGIFCALAYFLSPSRTSTFDMAMPRISNESKISLLGNSGPGMSPVSNVSQIPYFGNSGPQMCRSEVTNNQSDIDCATSAMKAGAPTEFTKTALAIIAIGMILQGCGKSPRQPYITTYVDDNINKQKTALYLGVIVSVSMFGPALGFGLGAVFSQTYVTLEKVSITIMDPRWVGAWWLGFIFFGFVAILSALPLLCFPRHLQRKKRQSTKSRGRRSQKKKGILKTIKEFLVSLKRLMTNARFVLLLLSLCIILFSVGGSITFTPKYLETQFNIPTWYANTLMGILTVVAASLGTLVGGILTTCLKFTPLTCIKFVTVLHIITLCFPILGLYIGCPNPTVIGYNAETAPALNTSNGTTSTCQSDCNCDNSEYFPVCGSDGLSYMSPCHAGCTGRFKMKYTNCTCVGGESTATPGLCQYSCNMLWPYLIISFIGALIGTMGVMPTAIFQLRCVSDEDKSLAIGVTSFLQTLLGWMPGPVVVGLIVDTSCRVWSSNCLGRGACSMYDIEDFRMKRHVLDIACKCVTIILSIILVIISRNRTDWSTDSHTPEDDEISVEGEEFLPEKQNMRNYFQNEDPIFKKKLNT